MNQLNNARSKKVKGGRKKGLTESTILNLDLPILTLPIPLDLVLVFTWLALPLLAFASLLTPKPRCINRSSTFLTLPPAPGNPIPRALQLPRRLGVPNKIHRPHPAQHTGRDLPWRIEEWARGRTVDRVREVREERGVVVRHADQVERFVPVRILFARTWVQCERRDGRSGRGVWPFGREAFEAVEGDAFFAGRVLDGRPDVVVAFCVAEREERARGRDGGRGDVR